MKRGLIAGSDPHVVAALQVMLYGQVCIDSLTAEHENEVLYAVTRRTYDWVMVEGDTARDRATISKIANRTHVIVVGNECNLPASALHLPSNARLSDRLKSVLDVTIH